MNAADARPVLVYDGECGVCSRGLRVLLRLDRRGVFRFAHVKGDFAAGVRERHPELRDMDSMLVVERSPQGGEVVRVRSDAALRVPELLGGAWRALSILRILPRGLRDAVYDFVARNRYRVAGRHEACGMAPDGLRARFID